MKYVVIITFLLIIGCQKNDRDFFKERFIHKGNIYLSDNIRLGGIDFLDVDGNGNLLITDRRARQVALFDKQGDLIKELSVEACHPGFNWQPFVAKFNPRGGILVLMNGPEGFWFKENGVCVSKTLPNSFTSAAFAFDHNGHYYLTSRNPQSTDMIKFDSLGNKIKAIGLDNMFKGLSSRVMSKDIAFSKKNGISVSNIFSKKIINYNTDDIKNKYLELEGTTFREPNNDYKNGGRGEKNSKDKMINIMNSSSIILDVNYINDDTLLVVYRNGFKMKSQQEIGIILMDGSGDPIFNEEILTDRTKAFVLAKFNKFYTVFQPKNNPKNPNCDSCGIPNEGLEVYELNISK